MSDVVSFVYIVVLLLLIAMTVAIVALRLSFSYTVGLVVVGLLISFFPGLPILHLTPELVMFVFLPALLFEGSWSISLPQLRQHWRTILLLAGPGLLLSLVIIAVPLHFLLGLDWSVAFLLGAILSPTDPVAVLGIFRQLHANSDLSTIIEGESLFNDGIAGVFYTIFLTLEIAFSHHTVPTTEAVWLQGAVIFLQEAVEGVLVGGVCGFLASRFTRHIDDPLIETTMTIITAYGVSLLANALNSSSILAVIVAVLILANYGQRTGMSKLTQQTVDTFWSVIAFLANTLLFLLVGIQLNPIRFLTSSAASSLLATASLTIVAVLLARFVLVLLLPRPNIPALGTAFWPWRLVIFWSGLRGALSLALVLALPFDTPDRDLLSFATYVVVLFTLLVQGLSMRWLIRILPGAESPAKAE